MNIAKRMSCIDASGIRKIFDLAKDLPNPINLSIGQPDFDVPDSIKQSAHQAIDEGYNKYTVTQGVASLRDKIKERMIERKGFTPEDVFITSGVSGGILLAFLATLDPGDELIVPDPYFVMYKHLGRLIGAVPKYLDLENDFSINIESLEKLMTNKTKMIVLNSPGNPTGKINSPEELKAIAKIAEKWGVLVISDEIYDGFVYDKEYQSIARYYDNTLVLGGFSKEYAMTGWRVGYAAGPSEVTNEMLKLQQYTFVCSPSIAQYAAITALDYDTTEIRKSYASKRDIIYNGLKDYFEVNKPDGAFYIFPKAPGGSGEAFVKKAIGNNLLIIPGNVFSEHDTHFRISFAASDDTIYKGIDVLVKLAKQF